MSEPEDGAIAIFPAARARRGFMTAPTPELVGFRCAGLHPGRSGVSELDEQACASLGKAGCVVSNSRVAGKAREDLGYIEVACADGRRGFMIGYALPAMTPTEAVV